MKLPGVGNPFVNEDQAGRILVEEFPKPVARVGRLTVILGNHCVAFFATQLPCDLAPERVHHSTVRLLLRLAGRNLRSHDDRSVHLRRDRERLLFQYRFDTREGRTRNTRKQVIQG